MIKLNTIATFHLAQLYTIKMLKIYFDYIHLIPRRKGDIEDPRGGVRSVIPYKQKYIK